DQIAAGAGLGYTVTEEGIRVPRGGDRDARDSGQFGLALRWLGDTTEYGLYFMNYHSRTPALSTRNHGYATYGAVVGLEPTTGAGAGSDSVPAAQLLQLLQRGAMYQAEFGGLLQAQRAGVLLGNCQHFLEYPEDIRLY